MFLRKKHILELSNLQHTIRTAIQNSKHQLDLLQIASESQKEAIATLVNLKKSGIGGKEIVDLMKTVNSKTNCHGSSFELDTDMGLPQQSLEGEMNEFLSHSAEHLYFDNAVFGRRECPGL